jgi:hypothetical protein
VASGGAGAAAQPYAAGQRFMTMTFTDALTQTISAERAAGHDQLIKEKQVEAEQAKITRDCEKLRRQQRGRGGS